MRLVRDGDCTTSLSSAGKPAFFVNKLGHQLALAENLEPFAYHTGIFISSSQVLAVDPPMGFPRKKKKLLMRDDNPNLIYFPHQQITQGMAKNHHHRMVYSVHILYTLIHMLYDYMDACISIYRSFFLSLYIYTYIYIYSYVHIYVWMYGYESIL